MSDGMSRLQRYGEEVRIALLETAADEARERASIARLCGELRDIASDKTLAAHVRITAQAARNVLKTLLEA